MLAESPSPKDSMHLNPQPILSLLFIIHEQVVLPTPQSHQSPNRTQVSHASQGGVCKTLAHNRNSILPLNDDRMNGPTRGVIVAVTCLYSLGVVGVELFFEEVEKATVAADVGPEVLGELDSLEPHRWGSGLVKLVCGKTR
jgi:hypothetical protein